MAGCKGLCDGNCCRKASTLVDHPLLVEYMKTYNGVATFKDTLSTLFLDKGRLTWAKVFLTNVC